MQARNTLSGCRYHLFGIAGRGMAPLAIAARHLGAEVSGCDRAGHPEGIASLQSSGLAFERAHSFDHPAPGTTVVATAVADESEPEIVAARAAGPVWHRTDLLAAVLETRRSLGVTGSHGKGTVAALAAAALEAGGLDPLAIVGAAVPAFGGMARLGSGPIVAEVDDSDLTLARVDTDVAVVTNLDDDHPYLDTTLRQAVAAVGEFVSQARDTVILGAFPRAHLLERHATTAVWRHGRDFDARVAGVDQEGTRLLLSGPRGETASAHVPLVGARIRHNAALAFATALSSGVEPEAAAEGLGTIRTIFRRLEPVGTRDGVRVFDDYGGKHPVNVRAGIQALRRHFPDAGITAVFEPYGPYLPPWGRRYAHALSGADRVVVAPTVYLADYAATPAGDAGWIDACRVDPVFVGSRREAADCAMALSRPGDVVVVFAQVRHGRSMSVLAAGGEAT